MRSLTGLLLLTACASVGSRTPPDPTPPPTILGTFRDDYGSTYRIADTLFEHLPRSRYRIIEWHPVEQFFIAQNDSSNPGEPGRWTRVDWMRLEGQDSWSWAFCLTDWNAPDAATARATPPARRDTPRNGCGGHPFTRMRALLINSGTALSPADVTGCYVVRIGPWSQHIEVPPPDSVWLYSDTVRTPAGTTAFRLEPSMPLAFRRTNHHSWQFVDGEVRLSWSSEFHGASMQLVRTDTGMVGSASFWTHVLQIIPPPRSKPEESLKADTYRVAPGPVASVVLRRCD